MTALSHALDLRLPERVAVIASDQEAITAAAAFARAIAPEAIARDREARLPYEELRELARTGLLGITVPRSHGGAGVSNVTVAEVFRIIAAVDPAVAQIPQNHIAFVDLLNRKGSDGQRAFFNAQFLAGARLGNALSERGGPTARDWVTRLLKQPDGTYRLNGQKYYCTGALTAQWIPAFAQDDRELLSVAYIPRDAPGVTVEQDWAAFGQRSTFSGSASFQDVVVDPDWVIEDPFAEAEPTTFAAFAQLVHSAIEVGIARGAITDGAAFLRDRARPARDAGVDHAREDPHLLRLAGELEARVRASEALLTRAGEALDSADANPADPDLITEARIAVAASKVFAGEVALNVATQIFEFSGASAGDSKHGLDRHWRNSRVHTLHDPARTKQIHVGRFVVSGVAPPTGDPLI